MTQTLIAAGAFKLKGSLFTMMVMQLLVTDETQLRAQLEQTVSQAPKFFHHTPVILDLEKLNQSIDLKAIKATLHDYSLITVGVRNLATQLEPEATAAGIGIISHSATQAESNNNNKHASKLITKPVRSGQQVYAPDGDLSIAASVSPGAEIIANGNIHVYGSLRGRALAGVNGDQQARIFCHDCTAELVSIAGIYQVQEDLPTFDQPGIVQIFLKESRLEFEQIT